MRPGSEATQWLLVHLDGMKLYGMTSAELGATEAWLQGAFDLRRTAGGTEFVSISTVCDAAAGSVLLHQGRYATEDLRTANMAHCKPVSMPLAVGQALLRVDLHDPPCTNALYLSVLGQCQYLATASRPTFLRLCHSLLALHLTRS